MKRLRRGWLRVGGQWLYLRVGGPARPDTPPVVLVAGLGMSGRYLAPTAAVLAERRLVVVPDLPGVGRSPRSRSPLEVTELADLVHELIAATMGSAVVVANSFGCPVAVELALRHPESVRALVLTSPAVAPGVRSLAPVVGRFLAAMSHEPWPYLGVALIDVARCSPRKGYVNLRALLCYPIEDRAARLDIPVVVVRGLLDRIVPEAFARRLAGRVRRGEYVELPAAHALPHSCPRALARMVLGIETDR